MSFFISDAVAATGAPAQGSPMSLILMLVVFGLIFYFMILRPQQKRTKEHKKLMDSIAKGDEVLTNGGLVGRVTKVAENGYMPKAINPPITPDRIRISGRSAPMRMRRGRITLSMVPTTQLQTSSTVPQVVSPVQ